MVLLIIIAIYWMAAAALFGIAEAYYFYHLNQAYDKRGRKYDHAFLTALRAMLAAPLLLITYHLSDNTITPTVLMLLFMLFCFPFIHDGMYYVMRNQLHKGTYPDGWRTNVDGRAFFDIAYNTRLMLFIAALVYLATSLIIKEVV